MKFLQSRMMSENIPIISRNAMFNAYSVQRLW